MDVIRAAALSGDQVLERLAVGKAGLSAAEAARRLARFGPNAVSSHRARFALVLWHQLRSPLLALLMTAAAVSYFVGERSDAVIIAMIVALSVGLGFVNEYRTEKAAEALHSQVSHQALVVRDGHPVAVNVTTLVPGDIVELKLGDIGRRSDERRPSYPGAGKAAAVLFLTALLAHELAHALVARPRGRRTGLHPIAARWRFRVGRAGPTSAASC